MQPAATDLFGAPMRDLEQSQLFTPLWLAMRMAEWVPRHARVLEPCCGDGNLVEALLRNGHPAQLITAVERDPAHADYARARFDGRVQVIHADFFEWAKDRAGPRTEFDYALMNPVYEENMHMRFVLAALDLTYWVVGLFPTDFTSTKERDSKLWVPRGVVRARADLPERVKFLGAGGQNEHFVLRIARRFNARDAGEVRMVHEETWRPSDRAQLEHLSEVP